MAPVPVSGINLGTESISPSSTHTYIGSCLCSSITVTLTLNEDIYAKPTGHLCHCANCRKISGSPAGVSVLMVPSSCVTVADPKEVLNTYYDPNTKSGRTIPRSFCMECGTPIGCAPTSMDERLSVIALSLFDRIPDVEFECFTAQRLSWVKAVAPEDKQYQYIDELVRHLPDLD